MAHSILPHAKRFKHL